MIRRLDKAGDNPNRYRIFLATPLDDFGHDWYRRPLYEQIASKMEQLGFVTFVPHKVIQDDWKGSQVNSLLRSAMLNSDIALADIGINQQSMQGSMEVGAMIVDATQACVPIIGFYEQGKRAQDAPQLNTEIAYRTDQELLEKLVEYIQER